jgi:RimJ/RimL family protein N-acetyltransferase
MNTKKDEFHYKSLLVTSRFLIRDLTEFDANEVYLNWLSDSVAVKFIEGTKHTHNLEGLKSYINEKTMLNDVRFFGIFDKITNVHIGNIKYEPINLIYSYAVMGVLIGDKNWRGKGVFSEVFSATSQHLAECYGLKKIYLGVSSEHMHAIKSYKKSGFVFVNNHPLGDSRSGFVMVFEGL